MVLSKCGHFVLRPLQYTLVFLDCDAPSEEDVTDVSYRSLELFSLRNAEESPAPHSPPRPSLPLNSWPARFRAPPSRLAAVPGFESARRTFAPVAYSATVPCGGDSYATSPPRPMAYTAPRSISTGKSTGLR